MGTLTGIGGGGGRRYRTNCFKCGAALQTFHDTCDERWIDKEVTPAQMVWELVADKPDREWFIAERGGLSHERCRWRDCPERRIKGLAFCYDHYFSYEKA
jgi:hypothetical protein